MKPEYDTIISAYLDGQLDPDEQQLVESALVSDAQLAEELRSLAAVRDLVAGLSREAQVDVSGRVMQQIAARRWRARAAAARPWRFSSIPVLAAASVVGAAAVLLVCVSLAQLLFLRNQPAPVPGAGRLPEVARVNSAGTAGEMLKTASGDLRAPSTESRRAENGTVGAHEVSLQRDRATPAVDARPPAPPLLEDVRQFLDNPSLRRIFLVSDTADGKAAQRVATVVEQSTRFGFYKFTIAQGIVIDPAHPEEATVFAVAVDARELVTLRDRLRAVVQGPVEEPAVDPAVVTQLTDIRQVQACPPAPLGDVLIPREELALRSPHHPEPTAEQERSDPVPPPASGATIPEAQPGTEPGPLPIASSGRQTGGPGGRSGRPPDPSRFSPGGPSAGSTPRSPERSAETIVVLVWVKRAHPC